MEIKIQLPTDTESGKIWLTENGEGGFREIVPIAGGGSNFLMRQSKEPKATITPEQEKVINEIRDIFLKSSPLK